MRLLEEFSVRPPRQKWITSLSRQDWLWHSRTFSIGVVFIAPADVQFSRFDIVEPDIVVVLNENPGIIHEKRIVGSPDIVVEIVSPSSSGRDRIRKAALSALNNVREYWLVEPKEKLIIVQVLEHGDFVPIEQPAGITRSFVLEGFDVSLDRLFRPIGPDRISPKEIV